MTKTTNRTVAAARERRLLIAATARALASDETAAHLSQAHDNNAYLRTLRAAITLVDPDREVEHLPEAECLYSDLVRGTKGSVEVYLQYCPSMPAEVCLYLPGCGQFHARTPDLHAAILLAYRLSMTPYAMLLEFARRGLPDAAAVRAWYDEQRRLTNF